MTFYTARQFPAWQGNLFVAALAGKHISRLVLDGERVVGEERLLTDLDTRMRDVRQGPDGALYVMTDGQEEDPQTDPKELNLNWRPRAGPPFAIHCLTPRLAPRLATPRLAI